MTNIRRIAHPLLINIAILVRFHRDLEADSGIRSAGKERLQPFSGVQAVRRAGVLRAVGSTKQARK